MPHRSFENYKESEWLTAEKEKCEERYNELENSLDAAFGTSADKGDIFFFSLVFSFYLNTFILPKIY